MRKLILLFALAWVAFTLSLMLTDDASAQTKTLRDFRKLQKELSYEVRLKQSKAFTLSSAKYALKEARKDAREERRSARRAAKRNAIYAKVRALKTGKE